MKHLLTIIIVCITLCFPSSAFASTYISKVTVSVTDGEGTVIQDATVSVTCGSTTISPTYANNLYTGYFGKDKCTQGKQIYATAVWNGKTQSTEPFVIPVNEKQTLAIVFGDEPVTQVPEFGIVTGAMALLTSGGSLLAFRRMRKS